MRGTLTSWWGKLSDDDFEWIEGQKDKLIGLVQEKYGYTRDQAQDKIERRFNGSGSNFPQLAASWSFQGLSFPHAFSGNLDETLTGPPIETFGGDDFRGISLGFVDTRQLATGSSFGNTRSRITVLSSTELPPLN
jgi:uncharacterized protein YjbJ (UPF0337 family)